MPRKIGEYISDNMFEICGRISPIRGGDLSFVCVLNRAFLARSWADSGVKF